MTGFENPVGPDQINQTHALELRMMSHRNYYEGKNDAHLAEILL